MMNARNGVPWRSFERSRSEAGGTYQESCPLGVLELRTSKQLTSICALGSS
jgi:hypothetical protein